MSIRSRALFMIMLTLPVLAQQQPAGPGKQTINKPTPATASKPQNLTVDGVIAMVEAGLSDDVIIARVRKDDKAFDLSPADMIRLKKAKVSDAILKIMLDPKAEIKPVAAEAYVSQPAPQSQTPPQELEVQPPAAAPAPSDRPSATPPGRFRKMLDFTKQSVKDASSGKDSASGPTQGGQKALDTAGLRNMLPQFDPDKPLSQQFPHVALTVLKAPHLWADTYLTTEGGRTGLFNGCFTVQAVVWSDGEHSKTVGPFDWCSPRDVQIQLGPTYLLSTKPTIKERLSGYLTGVDRTDGPRPPATLLPTDRDTQQLQTKNNAQRAAFDLNMDNATRLTLMFANLRHGMGQTLADNGDFRVWIVRINQ